MVRSAPDAVFVSRPRGARFRPRSVTGLLLASFGLVALPLMLAVVFSVNYVDRITDQSERLVLQGVKVTRYSKQLSELLLAMERSARQYGVLKSREPVERFARQTQEFETVLDSLAVLELDTLPDWNLQALRTQSRALARRLASQPQAVDDVLASLAALQRETERITAQGNLFIDRELARLQDTASEARRFLLLCVFALIPGVLGLGAFFVTVIARPLRQIAAATTRLGEGDFNHQIQVFAPTAELDDLGARLDWMRRRLAAQENEKQQFLRHMSHELKTPLASIREGADLLRDGTVGELNAAQADVANILHQSSLELAALIDNLLDFAAWRQQQARLEYTRFDMSAVMAAVLERQRLTVEARGLTVALPATPVAITADRERIQLILDNLLSNAVKYSPERASIRLSASADAGWVRLEVADAGPGVAADEREAVFDAFYQSRPDGSSQRYPKGTGIGLSVVHECVAAHGGRIEITDSELGGALVRIELPDAERHG